MRLPNGYGSVHKLQGKRRKPYRARKTIDWEIDEANSKVIQKFFTVGYYATKKEALEALAMYNMNPYSSVNSNATFIEIYESWSDNHFPKISKSNISSTRSVIKICQPLYNKKFAELKLHDYQTIFDNSNKNQPMLNKLKAVLSLMYTYSIKHEIVPESKRIVVSSIEIKAGNPNKNEHLAFTKSEIDILWKLSHGNKNIQCLLMLIYGGFRISEFLNIQKSHVDLTEQSVTITNSKTSSGIRTVPIADKVLPFYKSLVEESDSDYLLINKNGGRLSYINYYISYWSPLMELLASYGVSKHLIHDTRHTTITLLTEACVDERYIAKIVGHSQKTLAQKVYSHISNDTLLPEINKI